MMLTSGCWACRVTPPVWVWKRIICALSSVAPKRSFMTFAHIRRTARNLAISWKTLLWPLKKNARRWPKRLTSSPAAIPPST